MISVFTTGQAAKVCRVSQQTIIRCFDNGLLKGFRVPGSRFRRIPRDQLFEFMQSNGIPLDLLDGEPSINVLVVTGDAECAAFVTEAMSPERAFKTRVADNQVEAGIQFQTETPDAMVIDCSEGTLEATHIVGALRKRPAFDGTLIYALSPDEPCQTCPAPAGIEVFKKPFDAALLAERIHSIVRLRKELE